MALELSTIVIIVALSIAFVILLAIRVWDSCFCCGLRKRNHDERPTGVEPYTVSYGVSGLGGHCGADGGGADGCG